MNEELKGVAIDKLTSIEKSLGLKGENDGITFEDSTEFTQNVSDHYPIIFEFELEK